MRSLLFTYRRRTEMSSTGWVFVGLLFLGPFFAESNTEESSFSKHQRQRRGIVNLDALVKTVTGREGSEFVGYGNWCGLGGSGQPLDPIDECCQNHDFCYDLALEGVCREQGEKGVYLEDYKWKKMTDGNISCEDEDDKCKNDICTCDAIIAKCLKSNMDTYDVKKLHKPDIFEMWREANYLSNH